MVRDKRMSMYGGGASFPRFSLLISILFLVLLVVSCSDMVAFPQDWYVENVTKYDIELSCDGGDVVVPANSERNFSHDFTSKEFSISEKNTRQVELTKTKYKCYKIQYLPSYICIIHNKSSNKVVISETQGLLTDEKRKPVIVNPNAKAITEIHTTSPNIIAVFENSFDKPLVEVKYYPLENTVYVWVL